MAERHPATADGAKPVWRSGGRYVEDELARIALELSAILQLAIEAQNAATDQASRQRAEQERREKEKAVAELIAATPPVESLYHPVEQIQSAPLDSPFALHDIEADARKAQEIYRQITADAAKHKSERERIMQDLQTRILQIVPDAIPPARSSAHFSPRWTNTFASSSRISERRAEAPSHRLRGPKPPSICHEYVNAWTPSNSSKLDCPRIGVVGRMSPNAL